MNQENAGMTKGASLVLCAMMLAGTLCAASCNIVGPAYLLAKGPPKADAQYELPPERPVMVFVDDRLPVLGRRELRQMMAAAAQKGILDNKVSTNVIDYRAGVALADRETPGQPTDLVTLAQTAQCELIVYATVDAFSLSPDRQNMLPTARLRVKVLDATKDSPRVWPADAEGFPLLVQPMQRATPLPDKPSDELRAENAFAEQVGAAIAKLFYSHEIRESVGVDKK
ncbi:MAG: hypothetical protein ACOYN0_07950 [Phycisphaerales bacterium]